MTQQTFCGQEAHTHDESCYETILICGQDEQLPAEQPAPHVHTEDCCQTQYELICPLEEGEAEDEPEIPAHVHTDACYETRLICEKPEHTHSLSCYADAQADLESASVWEQTIPQTLSGQWRADVVAVAESQLGCAAAGTAAPQPGDLVFFDTGSDGYADHVALVAEVSADGASLTTIEGNVGGCVVRKQHVLDEAGLLGFGILPEQEDNGETPEEPAEPETPAR